MKNKTRAALPIRLLGNKKWQFISIPAFSILCSLLVSGIIILVIGKNPLAAFLSLLQGSGLVPKGSYSGGKGMLTDFFDLLDALTPMLFAAMAVATAYKAGLFNIGVSGQMLVAGFVATITVGYSQLPALIARPLVLVIGAVAGAAAGGLIGLLKYKFNINEVVSSIMLNYIFQYIISYFINTRYVDAVSRQSAAIGDNARLTLLNVELGPYKTRIPLVFLLAVAFALLLYFFLAKTKQGYELKAVGLNATCARYAGMSVRRNLLLAMILSGALAGLAGVTYYLGYYNSIPPGTLNSLGFDSIAVALLGNSHPIGILFSSLLITVLDKGSTYMSSSVGVRQEVTSLIIGMILLFSACGAYIRYRVEREERMAALKRRKEEQA